MVLDAVIGNTDRHHESWGFLRRQVGGQWKGRLAPTFDRASSLGRELLDERRLLLLEEKRVGWYSAKGRGGIEIAPATGTKVVVHVDGKTVEMDPNPEMLDNMDPVE